MHICAYTLSVSFEWDPVKAMANRRKHGVDFADAATVLEDDLALTIRDDTRDEEERWITMGKDSLGKVLVVVYTWRGTNVRLVSARMASTAERRQYEGQQ